MSSRLINCPFPGGWRSLTLTLALACASSAAAAPFWERSFGLAGYDNVMAAAVERAPSGEDAAFLIAGNTQGSPLGPYTPWLLKLSTGGEIIWQNAYGGSSWDALSDLILTADGGYAFTGSVGGDAAIWVGKLTSSGAIQWQQHFGLGFSYSTGKCIAQTPDAGYLVLGHAQINANTNGPVLLRLDSAGNLVWSKAFAPAAGEPTSLAHALCLTSDGGCILAASTAYYDYPTYDVWLLKLASDGVVQWQKTYGVTGSADSSEFANSIMQTADDGYIVASLTRPTVGGDYDIWIFKVNSSGSYIWQKRYDAGNEFEFGATLIPGSGDDFYCLAISGTYPAQPDDLLLLSVAGDGDLNWCRRYGGAADETSSYFDCNRLLARKADGGFFIAAQTSTFGDESDLWAVSTDAEGRILDCPYADGATVTVVNTTAGVSNTSAVLPKPTITTTAGTGSLASTTATTATQCTAFQIADLNCDGAVNAFDIDPFVLALTDPEAYAGVYADCNYMLADVNGDGVVNAFDIDPFVAALTG
jgi:hypothetical protein